MPIRFLFNFIVFVLVTWSSLTAASPTWSSNQKTELLQACYQKALTDANDQFKTSLRDQMPSLSYQAMINAHGEQLAISCQCLVNRITGSYSSQQIISSRSEVVSVANQLIAEGGACAVNIGQVFRDMYEALPAMQSSNQREG